MDIQIIKKFFLSALNSNVPTALWRLPNESNISGIIDLSNSQRIEGDETLNLNNLEEGFLIQPFLKAYGNFRFISASLKLDDFLKQNRISIPNDISPQLWEKFWQEYNHSQINTSSTDFLDTLGRIEVYQSKTPKDYIEVVEKAVQDIKEDKFKKVVLARTKIKKSTDKHLVDIFHNLSLNFSDSFVALVFHPDFGCWLGVSPEVLIRVDKNIFTTVALAGTQKLKKELQVSKISWSQKEIEEQALVARYIINCFKTLRLREYEDFGPRTILAGNLAHLKTDFKVDMDATGYPDLANQMLELLHPTSAVCGMPKESALNFILENEGINRGLYAGFWGPITKQKKIDLFVNLRCGRVFKDAFLLFAGAGITLDSEAEKEFEETESKAQVLGNYL